MVEAAIDSFGRLDIVVNNAGYTMDKAFTDCTEQDWDDLLNINLKAMFVTCSAAAPHLISRQYGRIINLSSVHSVQHVPGFVLYGTTKGAINAFTQSLAVELAPHKITVNAIAPGAIYVPRYDRDRSRQGSNREQDPGSRARRRRRHRQGRGFPGVARRGLHKRRSYVHRRRAHVSHASGLIVDSRALAETRLVSLQPVDLVVSERQGARLDQLV